MVTIRPVGLLHVAASADLTGAFPEHGLVLGGLLGHLHGEQACANFHAIMLHISWYLDDCTNLKLALFDVARPHSIC